MSETKREELDPRAREAVEAGIRAVTRDARTQLVSSGPVEHTAPDVTLVRLRLLVESGYPRRCRCWYDHRIELANVDG